MREYIHTDELTHHGVLGMKWGVRRYQNKDGTLTAAGKKRQDKINNKVSKAVDIHKQNIQWTKNDAKGLKKELDVTTTELKTNKGDYKKTTLYKDRSEQYEEKITKETFGYEYVYLKQLYAHNIASGKASVAALNRLGSLNVNYTPTKTVKNMVKDIRKAKQMSDYNKLYSEELKKVDKKYPKL